MNPVSAITGAMADLMLGDPEVRGYCSEVMREVGNWRPHWLPD